MKQAKTVIFVIIIIVQAAVIGWLLYDRNEQKKEITSYIEQIESTEYQKDSLTVELKELWAEYEYLKNNNDSLQTELTAEQKKIKELIDEIKYTRGVSSKKIQEYKNQIETLQNIMRHYIVQLDSLNQLNENLTAENRRIKTDYRKTQSEKKELEEENDSLSTRVQQAARLKTLDIKAKTLNRRERRIRKADKVRFIEVCFTLDENLVAQAGYKKIYMRISRPDGLILAKSRDNVFTYNNDNLLYSAKKNVKYIGEKLPVCMYWKNDELLIEGIYEVTVYADGFKIGATTFELR